MFVCYCLVEGRCALFVLHCLPFASCLDVEGCCFVFVRCLLMLVHCYCCLLFVVCGLLLFVACGLRCIVC